MLSSKAPEMVKGKTVLVVGCGGLGCYVVEYLARIGISNIIIADDDIFCCSNLNRQLYSNNNTLNNYKVQIAKERVLEINAGINCIIHKEKINSQNIDSIANGCDIVFDCCDNVATRLMLEAFCEKKGIILIHGALNDLYGQVAAVYPGDRTLANLYHNYEAKPSKTLSYVPAVVAGLQVNEGIKILTGEQSALRGKLMLIDLYNNSLKIVE